MSDELGRRAYRIFDEALTHDGAERDAFVARSCAGDGALLARVLALFAADRTGGLDTARLRGLGGARTNAADTSAHVDLAGRTVGHFRLLERIGGGGMGVVYRGERTDGIAQRVAVKIVRQELRGVVGRARFDLERASLARLEHPAIARLIDAGVTDDHLPWYAMEFVDGRPIDRFCDERALPLEARLELMIEVCHAVDAAHRALIVHRDIKPGNVLVTGDGRPKLIDFGIAKHMGESLDAELTRDTGTLFTSHFAAPEQVAGREIGTATDVFALGALAYRLITGKRIHDDTVRTDYEYLTTVTHRDVELASRVSGNRALRGDLDRILRKALERDPAQRYATAAELGAEFRRYLGHLPIHAQAPSILYRARKFARRHATAVALGTLLVAGAIGGVANYVSQSREVATQRDAARREAARAQQEADRAGRINEFLSSMLEAADPRLGDRDLTVAAALGRAVDQVDATMSRDPALAGTVLMTIASTQASSGRFADAVRVAARGIAYYERDPSRAVELASARADRAEWLERTGDLPGAEAALRDAVATLRRIAPSTSALAEAQRQLASVLTNAGNRDEAEPLFREALTSLRASGVRNMTLARTLNDFAVLLGSTGRASEALPLHRDALAIAIEALGPDSPFIDDVRNGLAGALGFTGRLEEALAVFRESAARRARVLGPTHQDTLWSMTAVAGALDDLGRFEEALPLATDAERALRADPGEKHPVSLFAAVNLGRAQCGSGRYDAGIATLGKVVALRAAIYGEAHWLVANSRVVLARCLLRANRLDAAERLLLPAVARLEAVQGPTFQRTQEAYADVATLHERRGNARRAAEWRAKIVAPSN